MSKQRKRGAQAPPRSARDGITGTCICTICDRKVAIVSDGRLAAHNMLGDEQQVCLGGGMKAVTLDMLATIGSRRNWDK